MKIATCLAIFFILVSIHPALSDDTSLSGAAAHTKTGSSACSLVTALDSALSGPGRMHFASQSFAQDDLSKCIDCCSMRMKQCNENEGRSMRCEVQFDNCITNCRTRGAIPANWACWKKS